ncbi:MAG: acetyltransferase [Elusimicrobia bacterium]|nr:acetyltransferase [Candidatus Liberimonas magnetica]
MTKNYKVYPNTKLGKGIKIGDYSIIGYSQDKNPKKTSIGNNANIRTHTVIYSGNKIGDNFQTGHHVMIRENNRIGNNVSIGTNSVIEHDVVLGDNVRVHSNVFIPEYTEIEENAWIGPNVVFTNAKYPRSKNVKDTLKGASVRKNAKIGANSTILPAVTIGENALIGAGSVVSKNVPQNKVVVGNPARVIRDITEIEEYNSKS